MNKQNTAALVIAAPLLYRLYGTTKSGWSIQYGFACGDGWLDLLMRLSVKIETELQAMLAAGKRRQDLPVAHQVKEKFGTLRFYVGGQPAHWREWIEEAIAESGKTCELCGQPGELSERGGWAATLCPRHLMLSGHVPGDYGEFYFIGSDECPDSRKGSRDGLDLLGVIKLATGNLDVWAPAKGLSRGVIYADELPPALWPALSRLANDQGGIPVSKATNYLYENRWQPNVRAVLGLPPVEPGDFAEEASQLIRHKDMELAGSVVLPGCKGAVPVFVPYDTPGLKIVAWEFMPESVADEFKKWHFGGQHPLGPYWYDFQAWVRSRK
jgi:hypothetical protein